MRFVDCVDYGEARTEIITGLAMVIQTDGDHIEIMHYRAHTMPDGSVENRIVSRHRWSLTNLAHARAQFEAALASFTRQREARCHMAAAH